MRNTNTKHFPLFLGGGALKYTTKATVHELATHHSSPTPERVKDTCKCVRCTFHFLE